MEHHGSWSKSTRAYWDARAIAAHIRQTANMEFPTPLSVISRRVLQTLPVAIALWRINASRIMQFHRRACQCYGAQQVRNSNEAEALAVGPLRWLLSRLELVPGISHPDLVNLKAPFSPLAIIGGVSTSPACEHAEKTSLPLANRDSTSMIVCTSGDSLA